MLPKKLSMMIDAPPPPEESGEVADAGGDPGESIAEDMLAAIATKDPKALASAMAAFCSLHGSPEPDGDEGGAEPAADGE